MTPSLSRRGFLGLAGGAVAATLIGCSTESSAPQAGAGSEAGGAAPTDASRRTLVVVQLAGGLDGLSALVPADSRYRDARGELAVAEAELVALDGTTDYALHPALAPLAGAWAGGRLAFVDGIGMEGQSRSHFAALDTMWSASPGEVRHSGWLGRWLDATAGGEDDPMRAVALGAGGPAMLGDTTAPTVVLDPAAFTLDAPRGSDVDLLRTAVEARGDPAAADPWAELAQRSWARTLRSVDALAAAGGAAPDDAADEAGRAGQANGRPGVASLLDVAAGIIELDAGTRVVQVAASGFDTHANQAQSLPPLLEDLATGIDAFDRRMADGGRSDDVLVLVQSEFGRRVQQNGSGTDHGRGGLALLVGDGVTGGQVVGGADLADLVEGDLPIVVDTRAVYRDVLDWLGGPTDEVVDGDVPALGLVTA